MRKTAVLISLIAAGTILIGCGSGNPSSGADSGEPVSSGSSPIDAGGQDAATEQPLSFSFQARNITIEMGGSASPVIGALGEPLSYFEAPSCAFDGIDKIYYFSGFELYTYPVGGDDFILSVNLTDDSVTTKEGVYLGMSYDDMLGAYGNDYVQNQGQYVYTRSDSTLSFLIEHGEIVVIIYNYTNAPVY